MKTKFLLIFVLVFPLQTALAQVGIGTTDPKSSLDIASSSLTNPTNTDGLLIPKIDNFPSTNPGTDQDGMMVYATGNGIPAKGFYYWDNSTTAWVSVIGFDTKNTLNGAYDEGGAGAGRFITTDNGPVQIDGNGGLRVDSQNNTHMLFVNSSQNEIGINTAFPSSMLDIVSTGVGGVTVPIVELTTTNAEDGMHVSLSGNIDGTAENLDGIYVSDNSTGSANSTRTKGFTAYMNGSSTTTSHEARSFESVITNSSSYIGNTYGYYHLNLSTSNGNQYGALNAIGNSGNGSHYGMYSTLTGSGSGNKYGVFSSINPTAGGTHYGIYSNATSATGYAGYFIGRSSFGTSFTNRYLMPNSDGTSGQIITTDGLGQLSFVDSNTLFTDTDSQNLTVATLTGTILNLGIQNGTGTSVNLSSLQDGNTQNTLDQAYDEGGPGVGSTIVADSGPVTISGGDGFWVIGNHGSGVPFSVTADLSTSFFNPRTSITRSGFASGTDWSSFNMGDYSVAMGFSPLASGIASIGFGYLSEAAGDRSTAMGNGTISPSFAETAIGNFNSNYTPDNSTAFDVDDRLFVIGNGTSSTTRRNALSIFKNGRMNINDAYNMPITDGTNGQVMTTDGAGNVSFQTIVGDGTGTDNQNLAPATLTGTTLNLGIQNGTGTSVNLSSLQDGTGNDWSLSGNNAFSTNFIGTTNNLDLSFRTNNTEYMRLSTSGQLEFLNTSESVKIGQFAGEGAGSRNVFIGHEAARFQGAVSLDNIGIGHEALRTVSGSSNIAIGSNTLRNTASNQNVAIGLSALSVNDTGTANTALGYVSLRDNDTGNNNTAIGGLSGRLNVSGSNNTYLGNRSGYSATGSDNVFIGYMSGFYELGNHKLYIENTTADADNALIYGEFDNNVLRINGEFQIGNPTLTGFTLPTLDGTNGQVLTTDGVGNVTFEDLVSDVDFYEYGTSTPPDNINDDKVTSGTITIGGLSAPTATINVLGDNDGYISGIRSLRTFSNNTSTIRRGITSLMESTGSNADQLVGYLSQIDGNLNTFAFNYNSRNDSNVNTFSVFYNGDYFNTTGTGELYGSNVNFFSGVSNTGSKIGYRSFIDASVPGQHFGLLSDVRKGNSFAGVFIGRVSIGSDSTLNRYILPTIDGTNGQVMTTDGSGNVSFENPNIGTDNQQIDTFSFNTSTNELTLEIEDDGQPARILDLSSLNPQKAIARLFMTVSQTETGSGITKVNFDSAQFDIGGNFNTTTDEYVIPETGIYRVTAQITMDASTGTGTFDVRIRVNGTQERRAEYNHTGNGQVVRQITSLISLTAGDTLDIAFNRPAIGATIQANSRASFFEIEQL